MLRWLQASLVAALIVSQLGCYNTYNVQLDELKKAAEGGTEAAVTVNTEDGQAVVVTEDSRLGVTGTDGTYHPISPFNFTVSRTQLVAPDENLLLSTQEIQTGNVKVVSGTKTTLLVAAGVLALLGGGLAIALSAPERKEFGE